MTWNPDPLIGPRAAARPFRRLLTPPRTRQPRGPGSEPGEPGEGSACRGGRGGVEGGD